jgi:hypothetical protein
MKSKSKGIFSVMKKKKEEGKSDKNQKNST